MEEKQCLECGRAFQGRSDKKFCTDSCRNSYNNRKKAPHSNSVRRINAILGRNRRILEEMNPSGKTKSHKDKLLKAGFDFNYITNTYKNKSGDEYRFCYEQGYLETGSGFLLLVKRED